MKYTKNEIGKLQDYEVTCDYINVTKFIKTNLSLNFYWKIIYVTLITHEFLPLNFQKKIAKRTQFQSAINYLCIGIIFIH